MSSEIEILRLSQAFARHAATRQGLIAQNVANADTPGYKAKDLPDFQKIVEKNPDFVLRATRPGHAGQAAVMAHVMDRSGAEAAPNGNTVAIEREMMNAAEVRQDFDTALGIYRKSMDILRMSLGRGR